MRVSNDEWSQHISEGAGACPACSAAVRLRGSGAGKGLSTCEAQKECRALVSSYCWCTAEQTKRLIKSAFIHFNPYSTWKTNKGWCYLSVNPHKFFPKEIKVNAWESWSPQHECWHSRIHLSLFCNLGDLQSNIQLLVHSLERKRTCWSARHASLHIPPRPIF